MTTAATGHAPFQHWMRYPDARVNNLLQIADYFDTFVNDEDVAAMRADVRNLTHIPLQTDLPDAAIDRLMSELRPPVNQAQKIEDGDLDAGEGWHDLSIAIEHLRDEAATIAEGALTLKGHRMYGLVAA